MITRRSAVFALNSVAGWVDAVGFLAVAGSVRAFPSFMSGNSTRVVTDLVTGQTALARMIGAIVLVFIAGAIVARLINDGTRWRETAALAVVSLVLALAAAGTMETRSGYTLLLALAFAMGMINRALQGSSGYTVHTFVTGAVVTIASDFADAITGRGPWSQILLPLAIWGAILLGATAGGLAMIHFGPALALAVPAILVAVLAIADGLGWIITPHDPIDGHVDAIEWREGN